ncbi:MAG: S8 family serine peptidase, partial [Bacteroidia bacterium]
VSISLKDIKAAKDSLSKLYPWLRYAEFNHLFNLFSANPNDQYFQSGDLNGFTSASHGVNLPLAWNYGVGTSNVKIGIFDTGINYKHEDFGNGTFAGSKLLDGKNFLTNSATSSETNPDNDGHGTACSGIIGALSNNNKGVAGVAGGDVSVSNTGCSILSMRLYDGTNQANAATIANAITEGVSYNPNTNFGYGLDVSNHSYGVEVNNLVVQQAVSTSYANSSIFVAASGNYPQVTAINALTYPASYSDPMVLKIGANDLSGDRAPFSVYDNNMDLVAPGTHDQYISLDAFANNGYTDIFTSGLYSGSQIDGTSFAAPHVAGVAGLMKSVHNTSMGAPANLAPEDVEIIMKNNATDVNAPGYDIYTGYGRLNAGGAVSKIAFPRYIIRHPTPVSAVQTIGPLNQQIVLANNVNGVAAGVYFADRYQMTWSYSELFPPGVQILDWWERASSEVGVDGQVPVSGSRNIQYSGVIVLGNAYLATATAFAWNITQDIIGNTMNAWIPTTPAGLRSAISIYAFDPNAAVGFKDVVKEDPYFSIYPNPTKDLLTIKYGSIKDEKATLEVWDSFGTQITKLPINTNQADGITINMSHLANGVYFCKLTGDNLTITRKFVKVD